MFIYTTILYCPAAVVFSQASRTDCMYYFQYAVLQLVHTLILFSVLYFSQLCLGVHRIQNFQIRPDPDPSQVQ